MSQFVVEAIDAHGDVIRSIPPPGQATPESTRGSGMPSGVALEVGDTAPECVHVVAQASQARAQRCDHLQRPHRGGVQPCGAGNEKRRGDHAATMPERTAARSRPAAVREDDLHRYVCAGKAASSRMGR